MKKSILFVLLAAVSGLCSNVSGQTNVPSAPDNANIQDNSLKMRSVEMERVKRDAVKDERAAAFASVNTQIESKFPEIKEDFEGIQLSQSAIIAAYTPGRPIDYAAIRASADEINKKAKRLDLNLFVATTNEPVEADPEKKEETRKSFRELIVELDETIGRFVTSPIFANLKVIESENAVNARVDLLKIQRLSDKLAEESKKMK